MSATKKNQMDLTTGNIVFKILKFSIPMIIAMLFQTSFNFIDRLMIGQYADLDTLAAVGESMPMIMFTMALSVGVFIGASTRIAQNYGKDDHEAVLKVVNTTYYMLIIISLIVTVVGAYFARKLLVVLQTPPEILELSITYIQLFFFSTLPLFGLWSVRSLAQGVGDSKTPLYFLLISIVCKLICNVILLKYLKLGIMGAGLGTIISQSIGFVAICWYYKRINHMVKLQFNWHYFNMHEFRRMLEIGVPASFHFVMINVIGMIVIYLINQHGKIVVTGYTVALQIEGLIFTIPFAFSQTVTTFAGQNVGANNMQRAKTGLHIISFIGLIYSIIMMFGLRYYTADIMLYFSNDTAVINAGLGYINTVSWLYPVIMTLIVFEGFFEGVGLAYISLIVIVFTTLAMIAFGLLLMQYYAEIGIYMGLSGSWCVGLILSYLVYRNPWWHDKVKV